MKYHDKIDHILLVDDDQDDCELFGEALHEFAPSIKLSCVTNNENLLFDLDRLQPQLVFMDVNMPKKNGYECLKEIRESANFASIPVIIYSNTGRPEDIDDAYKKGASLFLRKPSTYKALIQSLKEILAKEWTKPALVTAQYFLNGRYYPFSE